MNRRSFIGSILAACAALFAPRAIPAVIEGDQRDVIKARFETKAVILNEDWMCRVEQPESVQYGSMYMADGECFDDVMPGYLRARLDERIGCVAEMLRGEVESVEYFWFPSKPDDRRAYANARYWIRHA